MTEIVNNEEQQRFEINIEGEIAYLEYRFYKKDIALMHTVVPESMRKQGLATKLAEYAFAYAKKTKKPVMVYCPFVSKYIKSHPELNNLLDKEYYKR